MSLKLPVLQSVLFHSLTDPFPDPARTWVMKDNLLILYLYSYILPGARPKESSVTTRFTFIKE